MFFIFALLGIFFLSSPKSCHAQIPLFYQLFEAYKPYVINNPVVSIPTPTPIPTFIPTPTPVAVIPTPTPTTNQVLNIDTTNLNIGGDGKIYTVAVLGDSMIDTLGENIPQLETSLTRYFPNKKFSILNYGVGSSDIEYAFFRLNNSYQYLNKNFPSLISQNPDIIVIESFAYNNFGNSQSGIDRQWLGLGAITTTIKEKLPNCKIVLASTIAPNSLIFANGNPNAYFTSFEKIEKTNTIKLYLQNLINFANSEHFPLADAYFPSLLKNEGMIDLINPDDNIHPSELGKEFFCDTVAKTIFENNLIPQ